MKSVKYRQSIIIANLFVALLLTLTVNFSYLLSLMADKREMAAQADGAHPHKPEHVGILRLSVDGYGYIDCESSLEDCICDSIEHYHIFVSNRQVSRYNLHDGDTLRYTATPPRGRANPWLDQVLLQNGEKPDPVLYDRPTRVQDMVVQLLHYFILSYLLLSVVSLRFGNKIMTTPRYLRRCAIVLALTFVMYFFTPFISWRTGEILMIFQKEGRPIDWVVMLKCTIVFVVTVLYGRIYDLLSQKQQILLENEHLRNESLQSRYNMLMGQINPHFFFNSLNTLAMLVREEDNKKALDYIDQLSQTFRSIIQNGQNTTTTLAEEIDFARAYGELFKVRYADKLFINIEIDEQYNSYTMPALSLQPLIGNAVKHNTITRKSPFTIVIRTEGSMLVVENRKAPKLEPEPSTGIGLKNLSSRWQLITGCDIEIIDTDEKFIVRLPLQKPNV